MRFLVGASFGARLGSVAFGDFPGSPTISKAIPFVIRRGSTDIQSFNILYRDTE